MKAKYLFWLALFVYQTNLLAQSFQWSIFVGGSGTESVESACGDQYETDFISVGYYNSSDGDFTSVHGATDCFVQYYTMTLNLSWRTQFGGSDEDYLYDVKTFGDQIIAVGASKSNDYDITGNHGDFDYLVVKLDNAGNILWQKSFGGSGEDVATSIVGTSDGFMILGYSNSTDGDIATGANKGGFDLWLIKIDTDGNLLWQKNLGGSDTDKSGKIYNNVYTNTPDSFYISAYSKSSDGDLTENAGDYDFWLLSIDDNANIVWQKSYGGSGTDKEPVLNYDMGMGLYVVGASNSTDGVVQNPKGDFDFLFLVVNENNGNLEMSANFGGSGADFPTGIITFPMLTRNISYNPDVYIFGYSNSSDGDFTTNQGGYDAWILGLGLGVNIISQFNLGGSDDDILKGYISYLYTNQFFPNNFVLYGNSKSNDGYLTGNHGDTDAWLWGAYLEYGNGIDQEKLIRINAYPNPVDQLLWIENSNILEVSLTDETGREVLHHNLKSAVSMYQLNVSAVKTGNYFLKIRTKKGMGFKKILIR